MAGLAAEHERAIDDEHFGAMVFYTRSEIPDALVACDVLLASTGAQPSSSSVSSRRSSAASSAAVTLSRR